MKKYLVKWEDYDDSENTWEPKSVFKSLETVLETITYDNPEKIIDSKLEDGVESFLVKWKSFENTFNRWIDGNSVVIKEMVEKFKAEKGKNLNNVDNN